MGPNNCAPSPHTAAAVAIFGKGRLILHLQMGSSFSVALRENNLTSPALRRIEQNCFFFSARKQITKSQISDLNAD